MLILSHIKWLVGKKTHTKARETILFPKDFMLTDSTLQDAKEKKIEIVSDYLR